MNIVLYFFFFFQAEDGIRDYKVTGVQTCALPICTGRDRLAHFLTGRTKANRSTENFPMPAVSLREILQPAFEARYGVGAFNIVNDLTMSAVLDAAAEVKSPVIVQVSVKTVKMWGAKLIQQMFAEMASHRPIPATLHLDHCPDMEMIKTCIAAGWNSALFDASSLSYQDNLRLCKEVVAFAKKHGAG